MKKRDGEKVTLLSLVLRIYPLNKARFEQGLEEGKVGAMWIGLGEEIAGGHEEPSVRRVE